MILSPPVCYTLKLLLLLSLFSLLFCVLPNSCGFTPLLCKGESDYHLSHAWIICDGFQFQPSFYCFTEFVDFKNSFCELNLVLVSRKRLGNVIFGTVLVRRLFERGLAAEEVRGLLCNKHCLHCLLLLDMGCLRWATEWGTSEIAVYELLLRTLCARPSFLMYFLIPL
jgi:hypothetical protein